LRNYRVYRANSKHQCNIGIFWPVMVITSASGLLYSFSRNFCIFLRLTLLIWSFPCMPGTGVISKHFVNVNVVWRTDKRAINARIQSAQRLVERCLSLVPRHADCCHDPLNELGIKLLSSFCTQVKPSLCCAVCAPLFPTTLLPYHPFDSCQTRH